MKALATLPSASLCVCVCVPGLPAAGWQHHIKIPLGCTDWLRGMGPGLNQSHEGSCGGALHPAEETSCGADPRASGWIAALRIDRETAESTVTETNNFILKIFHC